MCPQTLTADTTHTEEVPMPYRWRILPCLSLSLFLSLCGVASALAAPPCPRIPRSQTVLRHFRQTHPCPATGTMQAHCPGYVIDHRWPLCAGGTDTVDNLAWQTLQAAKDKDRLEREVCRLRPHPCPHQGD